MQQNTLKVIETCVNLRKRLGSYFSSTETTSILLKNKNVTLVPKAVQFAKNLGKLRSERV
jgi:hypothetical protein